MTSTLRRSVLALLVPLTVAMIAPAAGAAPGGASQGERVPVVVTLADGVSAAQADDVARDHNARLGFVYEHALQGFSGEVPAGRLNGLAHDRRVASVERDRLWSIQQQSTPTGIDRSYADTVTADGTTLIGSGRTVDVDIAIVDTGIASHPDLNVAGGTNCAGGSPFSSRCADGSYPDGHGHGTHVAGTAAALDNGSGVVGVAPGARLWGVKVLKDSGSGYTSWIVAGIDWVAARGDIEVLNMSLGGSGISTAYKTAIDGAVADGVTVVVAAGNSSSDASNYSPAYVPSAITVSALADFDGDPGGLGGPTCRTDEDDTFADFSNYGDPVDIIAPGVCITSTWNDGGYNTISGTSMAAPHVAGAAALLASNGRSPAQIASDLRSSTNPWDTSTDPDSTHEPLLDLRGVTATVVDGSGGGGGGGGGEPTNTPPTASFTWSCTDLACTFDGTASDDDGDPLTYQWAFGDGTGDDTLDTSHTYTSGGTYTVQLAVGDGTTTTTVSESVTVSAPSDGGGGPPHKCHPKKGCPTP